MIELTAFSRRLTCTALLSTLVLSLGCGPEIPPLGIVTGVVTMSGKPLEGIEVVFLPDPEAGNLAKSARGETNSQGEYKLRFTPAGAKTRVDGAAIGQHIVSMSDNLSLNTRDKPFPYRISLGLNKASTTPFRETVVEGEQQIDFDLTKYRKKR